MENCNRRNAHFALRKLSADADALQRESPASRTLCSCQKRAHRSFGIIASTVEAHVLK